MPSPPLKPVVWLGDSLRELKTFPATVQDEMGYAVYLAQRGEKHVSARPLKGLGAGVLEVVSNYRGDTFRSVYTLRFADRVFSTPVLKSPPPFVADMYSFVFSTLIE